MELTLGALEDGKEKIIYQSFSLDKSAFDDSKTYKDAKLFKLNLKTSLHVTITGYGDSASQGVVYKSFLGIGNQKKIADPVEAQPLVDTVSFEDFDSYYVFAFLDTDQNYTLTFNFYLSNEVVDNFGVYKNLLILGGVLFLISIGVIVFICCCIRKKLEAEKEVTNQNEKKSCCYMNCNGCFKSKKPDAKVDLGPSQKPSRRKRKKKKSRQRDSEKKGIKI